ncbi:MAG: methyl-accepting chemotaxis protein [Pseudanabaenales cyanobacterium]|nr:methyl-accepting chemotaxis protein [Pseudanabaenales cyanobacterium]
MLSFQAQTALNTQASQPPNSQPRHLAVQTKQTFFQRLCALCWGARSLRSKTMALAIAIGVVPVAAVGGTAYLLVSESMTQGIVTEQEGRTIELHQEINTFTQQLVGDVEIISHLPLLVDPQLSAITSIDQKVALLNSFVDARKGQYDSIVVFDPNGNLLFQSDSTQPFNPNENYSNREYFNRAIATQATAINDPAAAESSGKVSIEVATPINQTGTGQLIGVARIRMPIKNFTQMFSAIQAQGWEYKLIDSQRKIFATGEEEMAGQPVGSDTVGLDRLLANMLNQVADISDNNPATDGLISTKVLPDRNDGKEFLVSLIPIERLDGMLEPGWSLAVSRPVDAAFASLRQLRRTLLLGTGLAAFLVGAIAAVLAHRATRPILEAAVAVGNIGRGALSTRLQISGQDELAVLAANINQMAAQLGIFVQQKAVEAKRSQQLKDFTLKITGVLDLKAIFNVAVEDSRQALQVDRVVVYGFDQNWEGTVLAESVADGWPKSLGAVIADPCFAHQYVEKYQQGQVQATPDVYRAGLKECHLQQLEVFSIKANLVTPILVGGKLFGLLIAHQCSGARNWKQTEIDLLTQLAAQLGLALERARLLNQEKTAKEKLSRRAIELLKEVYPVSQGNLSIRAKVTEDEVGTIADSFNSVIENLQEIVRRVQIAAQKVAATTNKNETFAQTLFEGAMQQAHEIATAQQRIQMMADSTRAVAANAKDAETAVQKAAGTVESGDMVMDLTVDGMLGIRETVAEAAKKVKHLGESSQKISKVVNLISGFADKTNILAMNASIEAARAGEDGQGFGMVAEEVRLLAQQSAKASGEIEKLIYSIQRETNEVIAAMEKGTEQVASGTKLVNETRQSLNHIKGASAEIKQLVESIASAAITQSKDSEEVSQTMTEVAAIAEQTSISVTHVSDSFKELLTVANSLEESVNQFHVE